MDDLKYYSHVLHQSLLHLVDAPMRQISSWARELGAPLGVSLYARLGAPLYAPFHAPPSRLEEASGEAHFKLTLVVGSPLCLNSWCELSAQISLTR